MFTVTKTMEIAGGHCLQLPYKSKCRNPHGHNWKISVTVQTETLNPEGMVLDFSHIKEVVNELDHQDLNVVLGPSVNPTAENIASWIARRIGESCPFNVYVIRVSVQESEGNVAVWER